MANYYRGSVNGLAALRDAIFAACRAEGWTATGEILSKGTVFIQVKVDGSYLTFQGGTSITNGALSGATQNSVSIAESMFVNAGAAGIPSITWPASYEIFIFEQEIYAVLNYNVDLYQWAAWGKSTVNGVAGTGMWFGASRRNGKRDIWAGWAMTPSSGGDLYGAPSLFWATNNWSGSSSWESYVHSGLEDGGWYPLDSRDTNVPGIAVVDPLIRVLPNSWNSEAVLLPMRTYQRRSSQKTSLIVDLEHARHVRIDNLEPGEIVTLGSDKWKVFPWYRKDSANRNGGSDIKHSGTFGWAIRYVA